MVKPFLFPDFRFGWEIPAHTINTQVWHFLHNHGTRRLSRLNSRSKKVSGHDFNSVLINLYRSGQDSNSWHSDNEPELGENPVIASFSLGATRRFRLRHRYRKDLPPHTFDLAAGSLLLMAGTTQKYWQHCLTKTARPVEPRINLTFRKVATS